MLLFWTWWQQLPLHIHPVAFTVLSIPVYWYALFFLGGATLVYFFSKEGYKNIFSPTEYQDFAFWVFASALIGGKLGFLLVYWYPFVYYKDAMFFFPERTGLALPGMSFVGGFIGVAIFTFLFAKKTKKNFFQLTDVLCLYLPIAIFFGRLGNFFHLELVGRVTTMPWGMYFSDASTLRHPSTLYAAFLEGMLLFSPLFFFAKKKQAPGVLTAYFLIFYGILRFISEFFREPDIQIGYIGVLTLNQIFAVGIFSVGIIIFSTQNAKK